MIRSFLYSCALGAALAGCTAGPSTPAVERELASLPSIRTFEDWIAANGYVLDDSEQARYDAGLALFGIVSEADLPVRHARSGIVEMPRAMFDRQQAGELDFHTDFAAWLEAGLYDPANEDQREQAARHVTGDPDYVLPATGNAAAATTTDTEEVPDDDDEDEGWNCKYIVNANGSAPVNTPPTTTWTDVTKACADFSGQSARHFIGGAPHLGAYANGGTRTSGFGLTFQCTQLANAGGPSESQVAVGYTVTTERADPGRPKKCPVSDVTVEARGKARLTADLHLDFVKRFEQWNPIGVVMPDVPWKGKANATVEAYVNNSNWKAIANGEIQVGSDCSASTGGSFGATAGQGNNGVNATVSTSITCRTDAWSAADNARTQPLFASVDDVPVTLGVTATSIMAGVKASGFSAEAWSANPPEGRPSFSRWDMRSNASAETRGGCIRVALISCALTRPVDGVGCMIGGSGQASYGTEGTECPAFPVVKAEVAQ